MAISTLVSHHPKPPLNPITPLKPNNHLLLSSRRLVTTTSLTVLLSWSFQFPFHHIPISSAAETPSASSILSGIVNTKSWFQFYGGGFAIRVPPQFEDILEPEDYNAGLSLYGDKVKPKAFAARFASSDGSEVLSVVTRPSNQLKITFLEAKDISDFGSLKDAAKIFVPAGSTLYSARAIKVKEEEGYRTYYFYEFGNEAQRVALVAAVNSGKTIIAGATAPQAKWIDDGMKLRSAAISLTVL